MSYSLADLLLINLVKPLALASLEENLGDGVEGGESPLDLRTKLIHQEPSLSSWWWRWRTQGSKIPFDTLKSFSRLGNRAAIVSLENILLWLSSGWRWCPCPRCSCGREMSTIAMASDVSFMKFSCSRRNWNISFLTILKVLSYVLFLALSMEGEEENSELL